eukprot:7823344-Ditylum_brightwellii.AAC.1
MENKKFTFKNTQCSGRNPVHEVVGSNCMKAGKKKWFISWVKTCSNHPNESRRCGAIWAAKA